MSAWGKLLRRAEGGRVLFWCPGCDEAHQIRIEGEHAWAFDGIVEAPTFSPSILVTGIYPLTDDEAARVLAGEKNVGRPMRCHSFIERGRIRFLNDCTHKMAGFTVPLPPFPGNDDAEPSRLPE